MASIFDPQPAPVFTRDGRDGFCSEAEFENILAEYILGLNPRKREKALMTQAMYDSILHTLTHPNNTRESTAQFRFWTKKMFRLVTTAHAQIVTHENRPVAVREQIYDVLVQCHSQCSHGGRDKTSNQVRRYYSWIPKELIARFVKACPLCAVRRQTKTGGQFGYTESTAGDSNSNSASSPSDAAPLSAPESVHTTPSHISGAAAAMQGHYRYPHQQQLPRRSSYTGSIPPAELPPMPIPDSTGSIAEWSEWVNSTPVRPGANSQQISPASSVPRHLREQPQHLQLQDQYHYHHQQQQQLQQKEAEEQVRHEQQQQQEQQHHEQYMQQLQYHYQMQMLQQQQQQQMYPHLAEQYPIGAQTAGTTITIDTANGPDVFTIIPDDSAQPYDQPHELQQYQDWSREQMSAGQSGHDGFTSQTAIDPGLLPLPTAPAYERRQSFDSVLTVDGSDSGSNSKDAPSLPPTPTLESLDQATSAEFDADVQQLKEAVDEYFLNYPQGGSDVVSQAASLEGMEGLALLKNVVAMTSEDLARSASRSSNRGTVNREADAQGPSDTQQVQITLQTTDSPSGAELVDASIIYTDSRARSASPAQATQTASNEVSQHYDHGTHAHNTEHGNEQAAGSANASFASDGPAFSLEGAESEETSRAPNSAESRVRQRPPALDLSAFTNNTAFLDPNSYNAAMYGSISGSVSAPAHVTQFLQPTFPIVSPTDETAHQASYYGTATTGTDWLSAPGHAAGLGRPASSMGLLQPHQFDASPTSPTGTASSCALSYSSSTSSTTESLSSSTGSHLSPSSGAAPKESGRTFFVPPLSMMPAIHSAPFFQMPLSTQQQAAVSRELSDSIQNLLENTQPNAGARPEKRARIDPHYRRLLADLHRP